MTLQNDRHEFMTGATEESVRGEDENKQTDEHWTILWANFLWFSTK